MGYTFEDLKRAYDQGWGDGKAHACPECGGEFQPPSQQEQRDQFLADTLSKCNSRDDKGDSHKAGRHG